MRVGGIKCYFHFSRRTVFLSFFRKSCQADVDVESKWRGHVTPKTKNDIGGARNVEWRLKFFLSAAAAVATLASLSHSLPLTLTLTHPSPLSKKPSVFHLICSSIFERECVCECVCECVGALACWMLEFSFSSISHTHTYTNTHQHTLFKRLSLALHEKVRVLRHSLSFSLFSFR